jgi:RNA polymerase sigma factor (sigma-70 family)
VNDRFPPTRPSVVQGVAATDSAVRERALATLVESYWRPIYTYLRWKWKATPEDAEDFTQGFFVTLLERGLVERFDPARARFRTYLRVCLDGWVSNERKAASRRKRGGDVEHRSLDFAAAEGDLARLAIPADADPDEIFHREWVRGLFTWAVDELRAECGRAGRERRFRAFEAYDLDPSPEGRPTYEELARQLQTSATQVTNDLHAARRRFREIVLARLRELTADDEEFDAEARELFGGGGAP